MSTDGQGTLWRRNIAENFNHLSRAHERYRRQTDRRQTTDGRTMTYSEHELEFMFAKNVTKIRLYFRLLRASIDPYQTLHSDRGHVAGTILHSPNCFWN